MPLNKEQKKIIKEAIHSSLQDLEKKFPNNELLVIEALQAITIFNASEEAIAKFKQSNLWGSMQTIIALLAHPYPEMETSPPLWGNYPDIKAMDYKTKFGEEAFKRGLLNLFAKIDRQHHGGTIWDDPTRLDVCIYIHKLVDKTKNNLISYEYMLAINQAPSLFKRVILDSRQLIGLAKKFPDQADALIQPVINDHTEFNRLITGSQSIAKGLIFKDIALHFPKHADQLFRHLLADDAYPHLVPNLEMLKILSDKFPNQTAALIQPILTKPELFDHMIDLIQRVLYFAKNFPEYKESLVQIIINSSSQFKRLIRHESWLPYLADQFPAHISIFGRPNIQEALQEVDKNYFKKISYQFSQHGFSNTLFGSSVINASETHSSKITSDSAYTQSWW